MTKQFKINAIMRKQFIVAFASVGISASGAFVAWDVTIPSEGVYDPYLDPVGIPTVCVGHMDRAIDMSKTYTLEECMKLFAKDWKTHQSQLDSVVKVPYKSEWQQQALTDFTFNLGIGNIQSSTLLKLLNQSKHVEACQQLSRWVKAGGKTLTGLVKRRNKELPYCLGDLPWDKQKAYNDFRIEYEKVSKQLETKTP